MKNRHRHQNPQIPHNNHHPGRAGTFWGVLNVLICAFGPHLSWDWILLLMGGCTFGGYVSGGHTALFIFIQHFITGQNGVHLVREISPWSSQVLCIGLAQNLKPILSDDKYWNINPNISAFGM